MKTNILAVLLATTVAGTALAQQHQDHQHAPQTAPQAAPQTPMGGMGQGMSGDQMAHMKSMMEMMQKMMPMMQKMQQGGASAATRADMMKQMAPMMQKMMPMMQGMMGSTGDAPNASLPHVKAYMEAMDKMHGPMGAGVAAKDPDEGFVRGMIPHHQGAIDMAKIVLQYGKDEQVKKWANDVVREQQREIDEMEAWLKKNAK